MTSILDAADLDRLVYEGAIGLALGWRMGTPLVRDVHRGVVVAQDWRWCDVSR